MKELLGNIQVVSVLLIVVLGNPALAHFIGTDEPNDRQRLTRHSPDQVQRAASPIFEFAPFRASTEGKAPALSDPLGLNSDASLKLFSGVVYNSDLLKSFQVLRYDQHQDVELPVGTLPQRALLTNYVTRFFTGETRAADRSLIRLKKDSGSRTWMGRPTTKETSPLTLAGFGSVGEWVKPRPTIWSQCDGVDKRMYNMTNAKKNKQLRRKPIIPPSYCFDI